MRHAIAGSKVVPVMISKPLKIGIGGPGGIWEKRRLLESLCAHGSSPTYQLAVKDHERYLHSRRRGVSLRGAACFPPTVSLALKQAVAHTRQSAKTRR